MNVKSNEGRTALEMAEKSWKYDKISYDVTEYLKSQMILPIENRYINCA